METAMLRDRPGPGLAVESPMKAKLWETDDPTTDELRERLMVVMRNMSYLAVKRHLREACIPHRICIMDDLTDAEVQKWLVALTRPPGGGQ